MIETSPNIMMCYC